MAAIGLLEVEFLIEASSSLKEKRRVVRSITDRIRGQYNVSTAEVDHLDKHRRCHLAVVTVCNSRDKAASRLEGAERIIEAHPEAEVIERLLSWL